MSKYSSLYPRNIYILLIPSTTVTFYLLSIHNTLTNVTSIRYDLLYYWPIYNSLIQYTIGSFISYWFSILLLIHSTFNTLMCYWFIVLLTLCLTDSWYFLYLGKNEKNSKIAIFAVGDKKMNPFSTYFFTSLSHKW